jgi:hypothetical protein
MKEFMEGGMFVVGKRAEVKGCSCVFLVKWARLAGCGGAKVYQPESMTKGGR